MPAGSDRLLSRRQMLLMAGSGAVACLPLRAATGDFWNRKPPADWTTEEIDRLITKSPWAKPVKAQYAAGAGNSDSGGYPGGTGTNTGGGYPGTGGGYPGGPGGGSGGGYPGGSGRSRGSIGIPGVGGLGIPGLGGSGRGRGNGGVSPYEGTVRWDSASPVLDALKAPLPEDFEGHYVICVSGIPLIGGRSTSSGEGDDSSTSRRQESDELDRLKGLSSLQAKGREIVQAGVVTRQIGTGSSFLFGFSRELLPLDTRDSDILFSTQLGRLLIKAHFLPKEMLYHGKLAV